MLVVAAVLAVERAPRRSRGGAARRSPRARRGRSRSARSTAALAIGTMSVVAPISASGVTLPVAVGLATGDRPSSLQAVGLVLTVLGVVARLARGARGRARAAASRASIGLALVAAVGLRRVLHALRRRRGRLGAVAARHQPDDGGAPAARRRSPRRAGPGLERLPARTLGVLALVGVLDLAATGLYALGQHEGRCCRSSRSSARCTRC